jgi:hypothetical protein
MQDRTSPQADTPIRPVCDQPERVTVTDPAHPLFRREFALAATTGPAVSGHALVVYRGDVLLRLPIRATSLCPASPRPPSSKLSLGAIRDLVCLASREGRTGRLPTVEAPAAEWAEDSAEPAPATSPRATGGER